MKSLTKITQEEIWNEMRKSLDKPFHERFKTLIWVYGEEYVREWEMSYLLGDEDEEEDEEEDE